MVSADYVMPWLGRQKSGWWFQTFFIFHNKKGMSSFPLTNSIIFQDGSNHQLEIGGILFPINVATTPSRHWTGPCMRSWHHGLSGWVVGTAWWMPVFHVLGIFLDIYRKNQKPLNDYGIHHPNKWLVGGFEHLDYFSIWIIFPYFSEG